MHIGLTMPINSPSAGGRFDSDLLDAGVKEESYPGTKWVYKGGWDQKQALLLLWAAPCWSSHPWMNHGDLQLTFKLLMYFGAQELLVIEKINALFSSWFPFLVFFGCFFFVCLFWVHTKVGRTAGDDEFEVLKCMKIAEQSCVQIKWGSSL